MVLSLLEKWFFMRDMRVQGCQWGWGTRSPSGMIVGLVTVHWITSFLWCTLVPEIKLSITVREAWCDGVWQVEVKKNSEMVAAERVSPLNLLHTSNITCTSTKPEKLVWRWSQVYFPPQVCTLWGDWGKVKRERVSILDIRSWKKKLSLNSENKWEWLSSFVLK